MSTELRALIASNNEYAARHDALASRLEATAKEKWNVSLDRESLLDLPAFKIFVITGEHFGDVEAELERDNESVRQAKKSVELQAALSDPTNSEHNAMLAELNALPPHTRMRKAREMGLDGSATNAPVQTVHDPIERARKGTRERVSIIIQHRVHELC